uniref:Uncharacterized protein n=1 Tax=Aureoumbra lagunensis TaxID=44058 RepID=A0A7S3NDA3_9STRA|mmetsp:Transcript_6864/g.9601  ORF Transcript_6864/g.9601 Transcript_6864/m.9601 type:complete len:242 (+) Transcript_6864:22-747(+)
MAVGVVDAATPPKNGSRFVSPVSIENDANSIDKTVEEDGGKISTKQAMTTASLFFLFGGIVGILLSALALRPNAVLKATPIALLAETEEVSRQTLIAVEGGQSQTQRVLAQVEEMSRSIERLEAALKDKELRDAQLLDSLKESISTVSESSPATRATSKQQEVESITTEKTKIPITSPPMPLEQHEADGKPHWWNVFRPLRNFHHRRQQHHQSLLHATEVIPAGGGPLVRENQKPPIPIHV